MNPSTQGLRSGFSRNSTLFRILLLGALILILQVPVSLIDDQIKSRQQTREVARAEVNAMWGSSQEIVGPVLSIPYTHRWVEKSITGQDIARKEQRTIRVLPEELRISADARTESRYRGIFNFSVYTAQLDLVGHFAPPDLKTQGIAGADVLWNRAEVLLYVSDQRAIQQEVRIEWAGKPAGFTPGAARLGGEGGRNGIRALVPLNAKKERHEFRIPLRFKGSQSVHFAPMAKSTNVTLKSNWAHPSFQGNWAPDSRTITEKGFESAWSIGYLGRSFPQTWLHGEDFGNAVSQSLFGVAFNSPVDEYRMAERSVKYAVLFLGLTFVLIWLYEVLGAVRVHPIQYLLLGAALCLFYLLLLALAEHIGFAFAYVLGATLITGQVTAYSAVALGSNGRAAVLGGLVGGLYGYLYVLLQLQDYALLIGAVGLFVALAAVMFATRRVDWYATSSGGDR